MTPVPVYGGLLAGLAMAMAVAGLMGSGPATPVFRDVATDAGIRTETVFGGKETKDFILETTGTGAAIFDYDGDGDNDIFVANGTRFDLHLEGMSPLPQLYRNSGTGKFDEVIRESGITATGWGGGVCTGDYDNDGRPDLLLTYYGHNRLYRNLGGRFEEVTEQAGLPVGGTRWGTGCAFLDYDRDGLLDFFVANYVDLDLAATPKPGEGSFCEWKGIPVMCGPRGLPMAENALFRNKGDGTFEDVSAKAGILKAGKRYGLGVVTADLDQDGWTDIYVGCDMTPSLFLRNKGDGTFEELGLESGTAVSFDGQLQAGMGVAVADYDGNGRPDIAKTNFSGDLPSLYNNEDGLFFTDLSQPAGLGAHTLLGWGIAFLDADEDGWPDLLIANGHVYPEVARLTTGDRYLQKTLLYRNLGNGRFADWTAEAGPAFAVERPSRGLAVGDLDGDGHPEAVIVNINAPPALLKNTGPKQNAVVIALEGTRSNRSAIGAEVRVDAGGPTQVQQVTGGGSYLSEHARERTFGLGQAERVDRLRVRWPNGETQTWADLPVNVRVSVKEGTEEVAQKALTGRGR